MLQHALDGAGDEQIGVVFHHAGDIARTFLQDQRQFVFRGFVFARHGFDAEAGHAGLHVGLGHVLQRKAHLGAGGRVRTAFHFDGVQQQIRRHVLMGVGTQRHLLDVTEILFHRGIAVQTGTEYQTVDEEADQPFDLGAIAARDGNTDADILLVAVTAEQHMVRTHQHHEGREVVLLAITFHLAGQGGAQRQREVSTIEGLDFRPRLVGGHTQHIGRTEQRVFPVVAQFVQRVALQPVALPHGKISVLDRQFRQRRGTAGGKRQIQRLNFLHQHREGPAIGNDVVHVQQQDMFLRRQFHDAGGEQRIVRQTVGDIGVLIHQPLHFPLLRCGIEARQIGQNGLPLARLAYTQLRHAIVLGEIGAQHFMPAHDLAEHAIQHCHIQRADDLQRGRQVVFAAALIELVDKPQPVLCERQCVAIGRVQRHDGWRGIHVAGGSGAADGMGEFFDGGRFEQRAHRQFHAEGLPDSRYHLGRQQRMSAHFEEIGGDAYLRQLQHLTPDIGDALFAVVARRNMGALIPRIRFGQGLAVNLAIGRERPGIQQYDGAGHHEIGQFFTQRVAASRNVERTRRDYIGHQAVVHHQREGIAHMRQCFQNAVDFAGLDAQAAQFHLEILAADVDQFAGIIVAHQIAGAVPSANTSAASAASANAKARRLECLFVQFGAIEITGANTDTGHAQLARGASGHQRALLVHDKQLRIGQRATDGHRTVNVVNLLQRAVRHHVGTFSGAVTVGERAVHTGRIEPVFQATEANRFATQHRMAQRGKRITRMTVLFHQRIKRRRRAVDDRHILLCDQLAKSFRIVILEIRNHQRSAGAERNEQIFLGQVEAERTQQQHARLIIQLQQLAIPFQQIALAAMINARAFWPAGRA